MMKKAVHIKISDDFIQQLSKTQENTVEPSEEIALFITGTSSKNIQYSSEQDFKPEFYKSVTELSISDLSATDVLAPSLFLSFPKIKNLSLENIYCSLNLSFLQKLTDLETLTITNTSLILKNITKIAQCSLLTSFTCLDNDNLNPSDIKELNISKNIEILIVNEENEWCGARDDVLTHISNRKVINFIFNSKFNAALKIITKKNVNLTNISDGASIFDYIEDLTTHLTINHSLPNENLEKFTYVMLNFLKNYPLTMSFIELAKHSDTLLIEHLKGTINLCSLYFRDNIGRTALHWACLLGKKELIKVLIAKEATLTFSQSPILIPDEMNLTPLDYAVLKKHYEIASVLLNALENKEDYKSYGENTKICHEAYCLSPKPDYTYYKKMYDSIIENSFRSDEILKNRFPEYTEKPVTLLDLKIHIQANQTIALLQKNSPPINSFPSSLSTIASRNNLISLFHCKHSDPPPFHWGVCKNRSYFKLLCIKLRR